MVSRGLKYNRNGGALTYDYYRYHPTTKAVEKHRFGLVPCRGVGISPIRPGEYEGVEIRNIQGGVSGTTKDSYTNDKSVIIYNGKVYGELYGGNDSVSESSGDPYYNDGSVGSPLQAGKGGYIEYDNPNCTRYVDVNHFMDDNGNSLGDNTYEVWANRILKNAPMKINAAGDNTATFILNSSDYTRKAGMTRSQEDLTNKEIWYTVNGESESEDLVFYKPSHSDERRIRCVISPDYVSRGQITHIGPIHWTASHQVFEMNTDLYMTITDGRGKRIGEVVDRDVIGMAGRTEGYFEWFAQWGGIEFNDGIVIEFHHSRKYDVHIHFSRTAFTDTGQSGYVKATGPKSGGKETTLYGYIPFSAKDGNKHFATWLSYDKWSFKEDTGNGLIINVSSDKYLNWDKSKLYAPSQPKYNGSDQIYEYIIRFRGIDSSWMDWNGEIKGSGTDGRPNGGYAKIGSDNRVFAFIGDNFGDFSSRGFVRDDNTGDVYRICENIDDIFRISDDNNLAYWKNYKLYHFKCSAYYFADGSDVPIINPKFTNIWTNTNGTVGIDGAEPGTRPGGKHIGWQVYTRNDVKVEGAYYDKYNVSNIVILGDDAKIIPVFADTPITINEYFVDSFDPMTGLEAYSSTPKQVPGLSEKPTQLDELQYLPGLEFCEPIGWYTKKYGGGQYITVDEYNRHTFSSNATIYAHYIINTIDGIEWGLCEKVGERWQWKEPSNFTGKDNVFFVGKGENITIGARVYPNDISYYGMITSIKQSNDMFVLTEVNNAQSGKELYRQVTPSNDLVASTLDYMVVTAYTDVGMKSQAFVFFVDKVNVALNTDVTNGMGDTIPSNPMTDHSDAALTAYYKSYKGRDPTDGDTIDEDGTPYHTIWIYHSTMVDIGEGVMRRWVDMGSASKTVETTLGRLDDVGKPKKYSFTQNRRIELVFRGWCDAKGKMITDSEGKVIGNDNVFLKSTELFASWIRPEDFAETDIMVIQKPLSKGDYSRLLQLKFIAPTKFGVSYSPTVSSTAIPTQTAENAFTFDTKVEQSISLSFSRVSPNEYNNASDDTDKWSNSAWMDALIGMQNRYQADTDGEKFLYIPVDCGLRRYKSRTSDLTGSYYRYTYYGYRYPLVGKCTDAPKGTVNTINDLTEIKNPQQKDIYYVKSVEQMFIYMVNDDEIYHWHLLMGHDTDPTHWSKGFLYTNAYGDKHYYLGRNVYIKKITPEYSFGSPTVIDFDVKFEVGGIKENEKDVIEW